MPRGTLPGPAHPSYKHGLRGSSIYNIWVNIRRRCHDPKCKQYKWYGARGIEVCERWRNDVAAFSADMGPRPLNHTVERLDNSKGYFPDNCVWATRKEQANNRRGKLMRITHNGKTQCASDWAAELGFEKGTIARRFNKGAPIEDVLSAKTHRKSRLLTLAGRTQSLPEWAKELGIKQNTLWGRVVSGWPDERVLTTPVVRRDREER